jgi:hypothetical protein
MNPKNKKQANKHWTKNQNLEAKDSQTVVPESISHEQASNNVEKTIPREQEDHFESPEEESLNDNSQVNKTDRSTKSERSESTNHIPSDIVHKSEDKVDIQYEVESKKEIKLNLDINTQVSENHSELNLHTKNSSRKASQNETKSISRKATEEKIVNTEEKVSTPKKIVGLTSDKKSSRKNTEEKSENVELEEKPVGRKPTDEYIKKPLSRKATEEKIEKPLSRNATEEKIEKPVSRKVTEEKIEKPLSRKATEEKIEKPVSRKATEEKLEKPVSRKVTEEKVEKPVSRKVTEEKIEKPVSRKATEEKIEKPVSRKATEEKIEKTNIKIEIETTKIEVIKTDQSDVILTEETPIVETIEEKQSQESETKIDASAESNLNNDILPETVQPEVAKEPEVDLIEQEMKKTLLNITAMKDEGNRLFKNGEFLKSEDAYKKGVDEVELYILNNKMSYEEFIVNPKYKDTFDEINKQRKFLFSNMANSLQKQKKYMDVIRIDQFVR